MADPDFVLLGDALWLDFVNTARRDAGGEHDRLPDPQAWHRWRKAERLHPDPDAVGFPEVLRFRDRLLALASALDQGRRAPAAAVDAINGLLAEVRCRPRLVRVGGAWRLDHAYPPGSPALQAIARSAARMLANPKVFVRECAGERCTLYFADDSLTQSRRFCSAGCGTGRLVERRRSAHR